MNKVLIIAIPTLFGCAGPSEAEVKAEFDAYVADRNQCTLDDDCSLVSSECPLPCVVAVTRGQEADVRAKAAALVDEYEGSRCVYRCGQVRAICSDGRCAVEPL
jgi:hypothetical protein